MDQKFDIDVYKSIPELIYNTEYKLTNIEKIPISFLNKYEPFRNNNALNIRIIYLLIIIIIIIIFINEIKNFLYI